MPGNEPDYRRLFEATPSLYLVLSRDFDIIAVSDAYAAATKVKREQVVGKSLFEVFPDNPDAPNEGARNLRASLERVRATLKPDAMAVQKYDIRRPEAEGGGFESRYWSPLNTPVLTATGELDCILHRALDVTDLMRAEGRGSEMETEVAERGRQVAEASRKLKEANAELERLYERSKEIDRLKTQFFANVSHELRTPLALIIGPVQRLLLEGPLEAAQKQLLDGVLRNAELLLKHVNDLLDASKLEAGKMQVEWADVDAAALVKRVGGYFETVAAERHLKLVIDAPQPAETQLDADKFQRVLVNLVANAFKFTPANGTVRLSCRAEGERAVFEVADSGPGIALEHREVIFERFRQLEGGSTRRFGGTGLGLAIARDFVSLHGGTLTVSTAPEGGALFTVSVPLRPPEGAHVQPAAPEAAPPVLLDLEKPLAPALHPVPPAPGTTKPLVLVVEDNVELNRFICETLAGDLQVEAAYDGTQGLAKAVTLLPDVILSDVMMPGMSGDQLVRELRAVRDLDATPVILLTAKADEALRVKLLRTGANDYLAKPFSVEELRARVKGFVQAKRSNDGLKQLTAELKRSNAELDAFSYSVAHDLRAPLRAIDGYSAILEEDFGAKLGEDGIALLGRVRSAAVHMGKLIEGLLDLARFSRTEVRRRQVDLSALARASVERLRAADPKRRAQTTIAPDLVVEGDPAMLAVVIDNLIGNAWKFSRDRDECHIELGSWLRDGERVFFVKDDGAGFDMKYVARLFGPFQRLHTQREFEGTGIGLATVQRIVHRHGGEVWAESEPGKGTTLSFTLAPRAAK
ncbi:MAG: response regulator [Myxococcaceae bacterium]|nr:response regulator [Myxococcaceae bacterium]